MLPERGPWEHPYYAIPDARVDLRFRDEEGNERNVAIRHKTLGEGRPLVLVHGLMTSSYSWRYVLEPLAKRYRVLAPDLVGSGASDKPLDLRYSVANVARFVAAYVRAVAPDEPVYLVGNSLGGLYCLRALLDAENASLARRFVIMHSPGYPLVRTKLSSVLFRTPGLGAAARAVIAAVAHRWPATFVAKNVHYARSDMMSVEETKEYGRIFATRAEASVFAKILDESLTAKEHAAIVARLRGWTPPCPIELLYATNDVMVPPSFGPRYAADIPSAKLVWMADASHFLHVDAPERTVAELLAFDAE
ncbi:MAG: alpha/beta hydrolase [Labilithrix sp.]|nr:alpha/beta hydrolase [Labilithrix sp.]MCW5817986.1 alpha/beta hydrolase [Labilithrix sp.]